MTREELTTRIEELERELEAVNGTPCEVYSRVVGYHRPVQNWNDGKREEFDRRKEYSIAL